MNKKIVLLTALALMVVSLVAYPLFQPRLNDDSTITSDGYYVQKSYEKVAKIIKPAIENYVQQDSNESPEQRSNRLSKYFPSDSPVPGYATEYLSPMVKQTTGKLTAVYAEMLEEEAVLYAVVSVAINYKDGNSVKTNNTYWINVDKDGSGNYTQVNDLGVWE